MEQRLALVQFMLECLKFRLKALNISIVMNSTTVHFYRLHALLLTYILHDNY